MHAHATRELGVRTVAAAKKPSKGGRWVRGQVVMVGEVCRATAGMGSRWAHGICDLASRPGIGMVGGAVHGQWTEWGGGYLTD